MGSAACVFTTPETTQEPCQPEKSKLIRMSLKFGHDRPIAWSCRGYVAEKILIIEDEEALRRSIARYLQRSGFDVAEASTCQEAFQMLEDHAFDVVLCDILLPDGQGFEIADRAGRQESPPPIIMITADDRIDNAINALHYRASDFLLKPFSFDALDLALDRARFAKSKEDPLESRPSQAPSPIEEWRARHAPQILGSHPSLMAVFGMIQRVADTDCSVLVTGESGTGKELVARAVHHASDRRGKPFITVNCAAIPDNLLESELFGHTKGAFTGATQARVGRFAAAHEGTIFLDEIGELPVGLQAKLLRVLQEKEVTPVGESKSQTVDVRVVTATNRDLEEMVEKGGFREDLLYRLNVIPVELPPLRNRASDIPDLIQHFIKRAATRRDRDVAGISEGAMEYMCAYDWPGNVRQLENTIERMVVLRAKGELTEDDLPIKIKTATPRVQALGNNAMLPDEGIDLRDAVEEFENQLILQALERTGWNKNQAASILRMNRTTLVEKIKKKKFDPLVQA